MKIVVIVGLTASNVVGSRSRLIGPGGNLAEAHPLRGLYVVERFVVLDSAGERGTGEEVDAASGTRSADDTDADTETETETETESAAAQSEDVRRWLRVGLTPPWIGTVQFADGTALRMRLQVDAEQGTLALYDRGAAGPSDDVFSFEQPESDVLVLRGTFEGEELEIRLRRLEQAALLTSRGFRWINEYPFNR